MYSLVSPNRADRIEFFQRGLDIQSQSVPCPIIYDIYLLCNNNTKIIFFQTHNAEICDGVLNVGRGTEFDDCPMDR